MIDSFDLLILAAALGALLFGLARRVRMWSVGAPASATDRAGDRAKGMLRDAVAHVRILRDRVPGLMHLGIFLGFALPLLAALAALAGLRLPGFLAAAVSLLLDLAALGALAGVGYALVRRYALRPPRLDNRPDDLVVLLLIAGVLVAGFSTAALRVARTGEGPFPSPATWLFALPLGLLGPEAQGAVQPWVWKVHFLLVCAVIAALPYTRLLHVVTSPLNVFFRNLGPRGVATKLNLEDDTADHFGVSAVEHLGWKDILDLDACTRCGRCQDGCPAHLTEKPLSPKKAIQDMKRKWLADARAILGRRAAGEKAPEGDVSLVDEAVTRDAIWSCTTCRYCEEHCPVFVEPVSKILDMRRHLVLGESAPPPEMNQTFKNLENNGNPWGIGFSTRGDWAAALEVPLLEAGAAEVDVLYWTGCAGSFDDRNKKISEAMVRIFRAAGVPFGVLGPEETCCGDPARRAGNEYLYQMQAQQNVETLKGRKFKRIVTSCPHCLHVLSVEYPQFGGHFAVVPHVKFILDLLDAGRLRLAPDAPGAPPSVRIVYHDSCYLGRYRGIYDEPRNLIARLTGAPPLEPDRARDRSFCCGAGGGRMWLEEHLGKRINLARFDQLAARDPGIVATACPYCLTMMDDAVKDRGQEEKVKARDLAELVAARLAPAGPPPQAPAAPSAPATA